MCYLTLLCPAKPPVAVAGNIVIDRIPDLSRNNQKCLCQGPGEVQVSRHLHGRIPDMSTGLLVRSFTGVSWLVWSVAD